MGNTTKFQRLVGVDSWQYRLDVLHGATSMAHMTPRNGEGGTANPLSSASRLRDGERDNHVLHGPSSHSRSPKTRQREELPELISGSWNIWRHEETDRQLSAARQAGKEVSQDMGGVLERGEKVGANLQKQQACYEEVVRRLVRSVAHQLRTVGSGERRLQAQRSMTCLKQEVGPMSSRCAGGDHSIFAW